MTISQGVIDKLASNRFFLLRMEVGVWRVWGNTGGTSVSLAYGSFFGDLPRPTRITYRGEELTEEFTGTPATGEWYYNETSGLISAEVAEATTLTNAPLVFYELYYSTQKSFRAPSDPEAAVSSTNPLRLWKPRILKNPVIKSSTKNATEGILTFGSTSYSIINEDGDLNKHFRDTSSFNNKRVKIWQCIDDVSNIRAIYEGKINRASIDRNLAKFNTYDGLFQINQDASFDIFRTGNVFEETEVKHRDGGTIFNIHPNQVGKPWRFTFGNKSAVRHERIATIPVDDNETTNPPVHEAVAGDATFGNEEFFTVLGGNCDEAINVSTTLTLPAPSQPTQLFYTSKHLAAAPILTRFITGTPTRLGEISTDGRVEDIGCTTHNLEIGSTFTINSTNSAAGDNPWIYCVVTEVKSSTRLRVILLEGQFTVSFNSGTFSFGAVNNIAGCGFDGSNYYPVSFASSQPEFIQVPSKLTPDGVSPLSSLRYYSDTFSCGQFFADISKGKTGRFTNATWNAGFDPDRHKMYYLAAYDDATGALFRHGAIMQRILEATGLKVNAASIASANSSLAEDMIITSPEIGAQATETYLKFIEKHLKSVLGYTYLNESFEIAYGIYTKDFSPSITTTERKILVKSLSTLIDYNNIVNSIKFQNPNVPVSDTNAHLIKESEPSQILHEKTVSQVYPHYLEDMSSRGDDILDFLSNRRATYSFATATENTNTNIGDDIRIESDKLIHKSTSNTGLRDVVVTETTRDGNRIRVKGLDLGDFSNGV